MADSVITEPSSSAISLTGYQRIINKLTKQSKGLAAVDFDDYADGATAPSVVAGGVYEINGTYYEVTADTQITGMSVVSTAYYIYSDSGVWTPSTTAPEWSESKQGWYDPSDANSRCFFKITTDSGGEYDKRGKITNTKASYLNGNYLAEEGSAIRRKTISFAFSGSETEGDLYDALSEHLVNNGDRIPVSGYGVHSTYGEIIFFYAQRVTSTGISVRFLDVGSGGITSSITGSDGSSSTLPLSAGGILLFFAESEKY